MEKVSFNVAKAIKAAGYPQIVTGYTEEGYKVNPFIRSNEKTVYSAPTYLEVWLWLWRTKNIELSVNSQGDNKVAVSIFNGNVTAMKIFMDFDDTEEAIIAAIEYLVDNNLIK